VKTSAAERARARARRLYPRSTAFQGAYMKGARAALAGKGPDACPYRRDPRRSWTQNFRVAWMRGHASISDV
jgi:ribosome modulation factor